MSVQVFSSVTNISGAMYSMGGGKDGTRNFIARTQIVEKCLKKLAVIPTAVLLQYSSTAGIYMTSQVLLKFNKTDNFSNLLYSKH